MPAWLRMTLRSLLAAHESKSPRTCARSRRNRVAPSIDGRATKREIRKSIAQSPWCCPPAPQVRNRRNCCENGRDLDESELRKKHQNEHTPVHKHIQTPKARSFHLRDMSANITALFFFGHSKDGAAPLQANRTCLAKKNSANSFWELLPKERHVSFPAIRQSTVMANSQ